jgi:hypothetical protein
MVNDNHGSYRSDHLGFFDTQLGGQLCQYVLPDPTAALGANIE